MNASNNYLWVNMYMLVAWDYSFKMFGRHQVYRLNFWNFRILTDKWLFVLSAFVEKFVPTAINSFKNRIFYRSPYLTIVQDNLLYLDLSAFYSHKQYDTIYRCDLIISDSEILLR